MFQTDKLVATQAKAIESVQVLAQLVVDNAKAVAEMQYGAAKDAATISQIKAGDLLKIKDPKEVLDLVKAENAQAVMAEMTAAQGKIAMVLRKSNQEVVEMFESAVDESKADLKKMVKQLSARVPAGSEAFENMFDYLIDSTLHTFDQVYSASKDAYANYEKSIDSAMNSFQGQSATVMKPSAKSRKAIAA